MRLRLGSIALVLALALVAVPAAGAAQRCNGEHVLCERTFDRVVLPAAHNAMSAADQGFLYPNQGVGIAEQLRLGIRGFLIDAYYGHPSAGGKVVKDDMRTPKSRLYLCHLSCENGSTPLTYALRDITAYLARHPDTVLELVVEDYVSPVDFAAAAQSAGLTKHVYRGSTVPWPALARMIRTHQQVVVLAEHTGGGAAVPWYHRAYTGILQETPYTWKTTTELTSPANREATCAPDRGGDTGSLFLMNHWAPPFAPKPEDSRQVNASSVIVARALACRKRRGLMPTTIAADMVDVGGLVDAVRRLNHLEAAG